MMPPEQLTENARQSLRVDQLHTMQFFQYDLFIGSRHVNRFFRRLLQG